MFATPHPALPTLARPSLPKYFLKSRRGSARDLSWSFTQLHGAHRHPPLLVLLHTLRGKKATCSGAGWLAWLKKGIINTISGCVAVSIPLNPSFLLLIFLLISG